MMTMVGDCEVNISSIVEALGADLGERTQDADIELAIKQYCSRETEQYSEYPEYTIPNNILRMYVPPVLLVLGTFGNLFTFLIMAKNMLRISTYCYLAVLAIMDMVVLYIGLLRMWVGNFSVDVQHTSNVMCKLVNFLGYVGSDTSVWLIIAVTVERFIAVNFPLRAPTMCSVQRARYVILGIVSSILITNAHILWTVELQVSVNTNKSLVMTKCEAGQNYELLVKVIWPWVDAAIYSFVPFATITILNVLIIKQVITARERRSQLQNMQMSTYSNGHSYKIKTSNRSNESSRKLTCMLLVVSFTFLLTTLPMNLHHIVTAISEANMQDEPMENIRENYARSTLIRTIVELLMYVNHSINFFLYCATGRKFRRQFRVMVCMCCSGRLREFLTSSKRTPTNSMRLTRFGSHSSPKTLLVDVDKRTLARQVS